MRYVGIVRGQAEAGATAWTTTPGPSEKPTRCKVNLETADPIPADLAAGVRTLTAAARHGLGPHPSAGELLSYHQEALGDAEAESIRDHLALCPECAQRSLDGAAFLQPDEAPAKLAPRSWRTLRRALAREGLLDRPGWKVRGLFASPRFAYATAAVFFMVSVSLGGWLATVHQTLAERSQPRPNPQLVDLFPAGSAVQRDLSRHQPTIPATPADDLVLVLHVLDPGSFATYRVEILGDGATIWASDAVTLSPEGELRVLVWRRLLADERYLVRLTGLDGVRTEPLAEYTLQFEPP